MISLDIRHPDVLDFIWCKSKPDKVFGTLTQVPDLSSANISLKLTDQFMQAVKNDEMWEFYFPDRDADKVKYEQEWDGDYDKWAARGGVFRVHKEIRAQEVMRQIAEAAHSSGDPGVMFIDSIQRMTPGTYIDPERLKPMSTNPCGEQPMAYWANCLLGATVLSKYVKYPWTTEAQFDLDTFREHAYTAVFFMNFVSDTNADMHPLQEQREADRYGKRIGIEVTGMGDMLAMMGLEYGSDKAADFLEDIFHQKAIVEIEASCDLAKKYQCCDALKKNSARTGFLDSPYIKQLGLPQSLKNDIMEHGLANTAFNTVGPAGSISIMAGNVTSGIEPVFRFSYTRETRMEPGKVFDLIHMPAVEFLLSDEGSHHLGKTPAQLCKDLYYREAQDIAPSDRIKMQAAVQKYTDSAVSSTINLPNTATIEDIEAIYTESWEKGLKGITVFRDGCKKGVLATKKEETFEKVEASQVQNIAPVLMDLQDIECGERHIVHWKGAKMFVFVSLLEDGSPVEVFALLPKEAGINGDGQYQAVAYQEKYSLWATITRFASLLLRMGTPVELVIKQLDKSSFAMVDAAGVLSRVLSHYIAHEEKLDESGNLVTIGQECPECHQMTFVHDGGCPTCRECGYTKCG